MVNCDNAVSLKLQCGTGIDSEYYALTRDGLNRPCEAFWGWGDCPQQ